MTVLEINFENFLPETREQYIRAGAQVLEIASRQTSRERGVIHLIGDNVAQWQHTNPPTTCGLARYPKSPLYILTALEKDWRRKNGTVSSWLFGSVGLMPLVVNESVPNAKLDSPHQVTELVKSRIEPTYAKWPKYRLPDGEERETFVGELFSFLKKAKVK